MLASTVHSLDYFTSVYLLLCIFFSFDYEPFVKIWIHTDYVCVFAAFFLLSLLFLFAVLFCEYMYSIRLRLSLQLPLSSLNFLCFVLRFLMMHALFNCFVLCLLYLLLPTPSFFHVIFSCICHYDCYGYNRFCHRRFWPSSYYV